MFKTSRLLEAPVKATNSNKHYDYHLTENTSKDAALIEFVRIGHATTLITINDQTILTDPWFSEKPGYYHGEPLGVSLDNLPKLSMVIVSHEHYDHFDMETFKSYPDKNVPFVVTAGLEEEVRAAGFDRVYEIDPWQTATIEGITVTACPAEHGVKENTFMIQSDKGTVYFGGDTKLIPELSELRNRFPSIDLAILSINGLMIRPLFNKQVVMSAEEAAQLCDILQPKVIVPIHYNFTGGRFRDKFLLKYNGTPEEFVNHVNEQSPSTQPFVLETGDQLSLYKNSV